MLIRLLNKTLLIGLATIMMLVVFLPFMPVHNATALTTESELSKKLSAQLGGDDVAPKVLGQAVSIPFYPRGFSYPIPELGNCDSKNSCYEFCQQASNLELCSMTSYRNGYMSAEQLKKTLTFNQYLQSGYFAGCNNLASCTQLCDIETSHSECSVLALNLENGSRVLGATDQTIQTSTGDSILNHCSSIGSCSSTSGYNATSILRALIATGQAPKNCVSGNVEQCQDYCSISQSNECTVLFQKIASLSGSLSGLPSLGRVLSMSIDSENPGGGGGDPTDTPSGPAPYQPTDFLTCATSSVPDIENPGIRDVGRFSSSLNSCGQQFSPSQGALETIGGNSKRAVGNTISGISDCIFTKKSSVDIASCFTE